MVNLYIFVEGSSDKKFFEKIIRPLFLTIYCDVKILTWRCETAKKINDYIKTMKRMENVVLFQTDYDTSKCYTNKKKSIIKVYKYLVESDIIISKIVIEGWYVAGIEVEIQRKLKFKEVIYNSNELSKDKFESVLTKKSERSNVETLILKEYDKDLACMHNESFNYFCTKWNI